MVKTSLWVGTASLPAGPPKGRGVGTPHSSGESPRVILKRRRVTTPRTSPIPTKRRSAGRTHRHCEDLREKDAGRKAGMNAGICFTGGRRVAQTRIPTLTDERPALPPSHFPLRRPSHLRPTPTPAHNRCDPRLTRIFLPRRNKGRRAPLGACARQPESGDTL